MSALTTLVKRARKSAQYKYCRFSLPSLEGRACEGFAGSILELIAASRRQRLASPIIDLPLTKMPQGFDAVRAHRIISYVLDNSARINATAALLADDESRAELRTVVAFRALGPLHVKLPRSDVVAEQNAQAKRTFEKASDTVFPPYDVGHYSFDFEGRHMTAECWEGNIRMTFFERQYYFARGDVRIQPMPGEVVLDCGACFGDTALAFASTVGPNGRVFSFEPLESQQAVFQRNLRSNPGLGGRIELVPFAVDEEPGKELFFDQGAGGRARVDGSSRVVTAAIDEFVRDNELKVDFIKMDIEGAERAALRGAADTIRSQRPKMGISIYHSLDDLFAIPELIKKIEPDYRLYVQHHTADRYETVLYAHAP